LKSPLVIVASGSSDAVVQALQAQVTTGFQAGDYFADDLQQ
jgi:hypothetical protein